MDHAIMYCEICDHIYIDVDYDDDIDMCIDCAKVVGV